MSDNSICRISINPINLDPIQCTGTKALDMM
jgi:hypothetical protein